MAFTGNYACNIFLSGAWSADFDFSTGTTDVFKIALYTNTATLNESTTAYTATGEVVASGYTAGGATLTPTLTAGGDPAYVTFANVSWSGAITARGALIYKDGGGAVCVLDFGSDKTSTTTFQIQFPQNSSDSAILRVGTE